MNRTPRQDLVDKVTPILERTGVFKLPLGDPYLEVDEREDYPRLIPEVIVPFMDAASACYLFSPPSGLRSPYAELFQQAPVGRGLLSLKMGSAQSLIEAESFWYLNESARGEFCFVVPVTKTQSGEIYRGAYMPTGFMNVGVVLSRRAIDFARKQTAHGTHLCVYYSEIGPSRCFFVFGDKASLTDEWIRSLRSGKCDKRMWSHFFV